MEKDDFLTECGPLYLPKDLPEPQCGVTDWAALGADESWSAVDYLNTIISMLQAKLARMEKLRQDLLEMDAEIEGVEGEMEIEIEVDADTYAEMKEREEMYYG